MDHPRIKWSLPYVFNGLAKTDLPAAAEWVESLDPELITVQLAGELASPWVRQAPEEALRWITSLPDDDVQRSALNVAAGNWPQDRLDELDAWLSAAASEERFDRARERLSKRYAEQDPLRALKIASAIADEDGRERATVPIAERLMKTNPDILKAWLPESGLPQKAQLEILLEDPNL